MTGLTIPLAGVFFAALLPAAAFAQEPTESYLFAETAPRATMADGTLILSGIDGELVWFADRPFREAGTLATAAVVEHWDESADSFADDPPNAALTGVSDKGLVTVIVELRDPELAGDELSFHYDLIEGDEVETMEGAALLIDGLDWEINYGSMQQ